MTVDETANTGEVMEERARPFSYYNRCDKIIYLTTYCFLFIADNNRYTDSENKERELNKLDFIWTNVGHYRI